MVYLANAFSLQMMDLTSPHTVTINPVTVDTVRGILLANGFVSAIGHQDTANVLANVLGVGVLMNRVSVSLTPDDTLVVAQVVGGRLPEGSTTLPDGVSIQFVVVKVQG